jgi:type II secretory pathway pseudopilin PulG
MTLVELLVAATVIGMLMGIVLPVVSRARNRADLVTCRIHLRNLGVAMHLYANDHDSRLPVDETLDNPHTGLIGTLGADHYVVGARNYYCPGERRSELSFSQANFEAGNIGYFYFSCERASTDRRVSTFLRWDTRWPRRLTTDMSPQVWVFSDTWYSGEPTSHYSYKRGINFVTLGGSVTMVQRRPRREFR